MTNSKSYTVTILIKPSRVNGLGISSGLIHDEKMNIVTDYVCQWLSVTVCKSISKKSSRINKFLVVAHERGQRERAPEGDHDGRVKRREERLWRRGVVVAAVHALYAERDVADGAEPEPAQRVL